MRKNLKEKVSNLTNDHERLKKKKKILARKGRNERILGNE